MIAWNFQRIVGTCQFRVPWFGYPCGYSSLTHYHLFDAFLYELRPSTLVVCTSCEQPVIIVAIIPMTTAFFGNFFFNIINLSISMINY